jgi:hypothetical protein
LEENSPEAPLPPPPPLLTNPSKKGVGDGVRWRRRWMEGMRRRRRWREGRRGRTYPELVAGAAREKAAAGSPSAGRKERRTTRRLIFFPVCGGLD